MTCYETVFMARPDLTETQVQAVTDAATALIKKSSGKILKTEYWGLRTLAFRVNKNRKAHYVLIEWEGPGAMITELERILRLNEDVMRSLTVSREEPSDGPSAPLEQGRDDRPSHPYNNTDKSDDKEAA